MFPDFATQIRTILGLVPDLCPFPTFSRRICSAENASAMTPVMSKCRMSKQGSSSSSLSISIDTTPTSTKMSADYTESELSSEEDDIYKQVQTLLTKLSPQKRQKLAMRGICTPKTGRKRLAHTQIVGKMLDEAETLKTSRSKQSIMRRRSLLGALSCSSDESLTDLAAKQPVSESDTSVHSPKIEVRPHGFFSRGYLPDSPGVSPVLDVPDSPRVSPFVDVPDSPGVSPVLDVPDSPRVSPVVDAPDSPGVSPVLDVPDSPEVSPVVDVPDSPEVSPFVDVPDSPEDQPSHRCARLSRGSAQS